MSCGGGEASETEAPGLEPAQNELLRTVAACVEQVTAAEDFQINAIAYQNLLVHIAVALVRIDENCYVPMPNEELERIKGGREYDIACKIAALLGERTGVELPEEEAAYIAIHLAGKQTIDAAPGDSDGGLVISEEVWSLVTAMLERVWRAFRFDFRNDLELRMNLAQHIVPLSVRLRYRMNLKNPLLQDIKTRYALAFSMALDASSVLSAHYGADISEDEVGYIALAFALALERQKAATPRKNILVVCASGAGSARLLEYRCRQEFGDYIDTISTCDVLNLSKVDFSNIDYVFTTVPLSQKLPVPVREVTYFFDADEAQDMREFLRASNRRHDFALSCFDCELFFPHLAGATKQEVLDALLDGMCAHRDLPENFRELVWKREGTVATAFGNNVAMPHPLEASSDETFIAIGLLDRPVVWDAAGTTVQAVFLCSFSRAGGPEVQDFFSLFADMLMDRRAIASIMADQTWDTFAAVLSTFTRAADADDADTDPAPNP